MSGEVMEAQPTLAELVTSELVVCAHCMDVYTQPVLLPCLHTLCAECVTDIAMHSLNIASKNRTHSGSGTSPTDQSWDRQLCLHCPVCQASLTLWGDDQADHSSEDESEVDCGSADEDGSGDKPKDGAEASRPTSKRGVSREGTAVLNGREDGRKANNISSSSNVNSSNSDVNNASVSSSSSTSNSNHSTVSSKNNSAGQTRKDSAVTSPADKKMLKTRKLVRRVVVNSLTPNAFLAAVAQLRRHKGGGGDSVTPRECQYCRTDGVVKPATTLCLQCLDDMCDECTAAHRKTRVTREHRVAPYAQIRQGLYDHDIRAAGVTPCWSPGTHRHGHAQPGAAEPSPVTHFCSDCREPVCKQCRGAARHRGHDLRPLAQAAPMLTPEVKCVQEALGRRVPELEGYVRFLQDQVIQLDNARQHVISEIRSQVAEIKAMLHEYEVKAVADLEEACNKEKAALARKTSDMRTAAGSLGRTARFLTALTTLGRPEEVASLYRSIMERHRQLLNARPDLLTRKLSSVFQPGPCTEQNVQILVGDLELSMVRVDGEDAPQNRLPMATLMPPVLNPPQLITSFTVSTSSDTEPVYPSGIAISKAMLALVDRQNAKVKVYDLKGKLLKEFSGTEVKDSRLVKPYDVAFLPNGALAVSDSGAGAVRVFVWTGQFITTFQGDVRHPRGVVLSAQGEVLVVDGHLRHVTVHDASNGALVRTIQPTPAVTKPDHDAGDDEEKVYLQPKRTVRGKTTRLEAGNGDRESPRGRHAPAQKNKTVKAEEAKNGESQGRVTSSTKAHNNVLIDPHYLTIGPDNTLIISDAASPNLKFLDSRSGQLLTTAMDYGTGPQESLHPAGVAVDKFGYLLLADTNNNRVHLGLPSGRMASVLLDKTHGLCRPVSLAIDSEGHLVVAQAGGEVRVYRYL